MSTYISAVVAEINEERLLRNTVLESDSTHNFPDEASPSLAELESGSTQRLSCRPAGHVLFESLPENTFQRNTNCFILC